MDPLPLAIAFVLGFIVASLIWNWRLRRERNKHAGADMILQEIKDLLR